MLVTNRLTNVRKGTVCAQRAKYVSVKGCVCECVCARMCINLLSFIAEYKVRGICE